MNETIGKSRVVLEKTQLAAVLAARGLHATSYLRVGFQANESVRNSM
jgi:hypothetical protein